MSTRWIRITGMIMGLVVILLLASSSYSEIDLATVVAAWLFDEGSGNIAGDSSGNGNDGDIDDASWVDGKFGGALEFDGTSSTVHVPALGSFDEITIAVWAYSTGRVGSWRVLINVDGWKAGDIHHQLHTNNQVEFSINGNPGGNDTFATFTFDGSQLEVWHHLATVYNSGKGWIRFYVDGELNIENQWGGNPGVIDAAQIGHWTGEDGRGWQGMLDEFVILNVAIEQDDIQDLMNNGFEGGQSVEPTGKLAISWGSIRQ